MYSVDAKDKVVELKSVPQCDIGAPLPVVVSNEHSIQLAYIVSEADPNWDGSYVKLISADSANLPIAVVTFQGSLVHMFGPPNDEAFVGHPLASRGLRPYSICEVLNSSWIRRLELMNSVHPHHRPEFFETYRHFVFAFHDSTFECVADSFKVATHRGSIRTALQSMADSLHK